MASLLKDKPRHEFHRIAEGGAVVFFLSPHCFTSPKDRKERNSDGLLWPIRRERSIEFHLAEGKGKGRTRREREGK